MFQGREYSRPFFIGLFLIVSTLHIAIASTTSLPGRLERNLEQIIGFARRAAEDGAQLLLTPEMSATGYGGYAEVLALAEVAGQGRVYQALSQAARETGVVICAGFVEQSPHEDKKYLAHYAIYPDGHFVVQRKHRVTPAEAPLSPASGFHEADNEGIGVPEQIQIETFEVHGVRCAVVICADTGIENLDEILKAQKVQLLLAPTGAGGKRQERVTTEDLESPTGREKYFSVLQAVFMPGRAPLECIQNQRALAAVNLCGFDGVAHYHVGHGSIVNAMGEVLGFFHGLPNLDRQRPMYAHAKIDTAEFVEGVTL
jgi:predicted amidohydrolase